MKLNRYIYVIRRKSFEDYFLAYPSHILGLIDSLISILTLGVVGCSFRIEYLRHDIRRQMKKLQKDKQ